jgi:hypothetical protein
MCIDHVAGNHTAEFDSAVWNRSLSDLAISRSEKKKIIFHLSAFVFLLITTEAV